jgi:alkanesulfonate monooxygenase SsuD/methylene tetrahydromethanopterin reductase-like flavin-dependent oxidoreductase (luciferase family)
MSGVAKPAGPEGHPLFRSNNRLKMGSFAWSLQGGATPTLAEGTIGKLNWAQQVQLAKLSEAIGLDAIIPVARWKGCGGPSHFWNESYDTIAWSAALAGATEKVTVFSTVHVPLIHPVRAAKTAVTIDHISGGRFALNIVAGWMQTEFSMFGYQRLPHDERYVQAEEWLSFLKKLWAEDKAFDWSGKYYQAEGAISEPRPAGTRPLLMSAGGSPAGRTFAAKNCDVIFINIRDGPKQAALTIKDIKDQAAAHGREVQVWTTAGLICRPTEAEARRHYNYFVWEKGDFQAAEVLAKGSQSGDSQSVQTTESKRLLEGIVAWTFAYPLVNTPERVVDELAAFADAGLDGVAFICQNFEQELEIFGEEIRPLAQKAGLMAS